MQERFRRNSRTMKTLGKWQRCPNSKSCANYLCKSWTQRDGSQR